MMLHLRSTKDTPKMLRETVAYAQTYLPLTPEGQGHRDRLGRIAEEIDRMRPLGPNGKHGDRHTPVCGCDDPDDGRDEEVDLDLEDDSHPEREPLLYRIRARVRRELVLLECLGFSAHTRCTHTPALAGGVA